MTPFEEAIEITLIHEGFTPERGGAFTDDPADPGGATKWGISLRFLRALGRLVGDLDGDGDVDADDVKLLKRARAVALYKAEFWDRYGYADFFDRNVAAKVFDLAVNMGPKGAHRCLQRALRAWGIEVVEDGILGPKTRTATNGAHGPTVLVALRSEAAGYYRRLEARQPAFERFIKGWLNRAYS